MEGMTLKQYNLQTFFRLCEEYREAKKNMSTAEARATFVVLSVQVHIAKSNVPKRYWPMANR